LHASEKGAALLSWLREKVSIVSPRTRDPDYVGIQTGLTGKPSLGQICHLIWLLPQSAVFRTETQYPNPSLKWIKIRLPHFSQLADSLAVAKLFSIHQS
jgi:hypothetical protein